jgi:hypothetical protein
MTTSDTPAISPVAQIRALHERLIRAEALVCSEKVHPVVDIPGRYIVEGRKGYYLVNSSCNCPDATNRTELLKGYCKHRLAAVIYAEQQAKAPATKESKPALSEVEGAESPKDEELERQIAELYH